MTVEIKDLSDSDFINQFENLVLDKSHFNHLGHLRLAWLYLSEYELEVALQKVCDGIKAFANKLGATDKFHLTLTDAIVRIMAKRMSQSSSNSWQSFLAENHDLVGNAKAVLLQYFRGSTLFTDEARLSLVSPDLQEF